jgi:hypothetical protein
VKDNKGFEKGTYLNAEFVRKRKFNESYKNGLLDEKPQIGEFINQIKNMPESEKYTIENFAKIISFQKDLLFDSNDLMQITSRKLKEFCPLEYMKFCKEKDIIPDSFISHIKFDNFYWSASDNPSNVVSNYSEEELKELVDFSFYQLTVGAEDRSGKDLRSYGEKYLKEGADQSLLDTKKLISDLKQEFLKRKNTLSKEDLIKIYAKNAEFSKIFE